MFDHFRQSGPVFAPAQGLERANISQHAARLVKGTDQVLAADVIDAGLAAHRRIHLGQQGGGHLDEVDAALETGGGEAA